MILSSYKYIHIVFLGKELLVSLLNPKKNFVEKFVEKLNDKNWMQVLNLSKLTELI